jgi:hypothetical protein
MCCVDPEKYFGGYFDRITASLVTDAELPYLDGGLPGNDYQCGVRQLSLLGLNHRQLTVKIQ